jgi:hypothetical protein
MANFEEGWRQGEKAGGVIFFFLRIIWFFVRIAWWLAVFVLLWIGAGMMALTRLGRPRPDDTAGFGRYSDDHRLWLDDASGLQYPSSRSDTEYCEVEADQTGMYWRRTAASRLLKGGAIVHYKFYAVRKQAPGEGSGPVVAAETEFPQEARHNITLDHLDPAHAHEDPYGLSGNRDLATQALDDLEWILDKRGWERVDARDQHGEHWYSTVYKRPVISWDEPLPVADQAPGDAA